MFAFVDHEHLAGDGDADAGGEAEAEVAVDGGVGFDGECRGEDGGAPDVTRRRN